jgi:hypothetical protein
VLEVVALYAALWLIVAFAAWVLVGMLFAFLHDVDEPA